GRADRDRVDVSVKDLIDARGGWHPQLGSHISSGRRSRVVDRTDRDAVDLMGEHVRMHPPDPPHPDHADPQRRHGGRGRLHQPAPGGSVGGPANGTTSSQRPLLTDRSSASCTHANCSACSNPGSNARPSATARQNSKSSIVTRSSKPIAFPAPGTNTPWWPKR